jgi:electron transport complex protein RnfG
MSAETLSAETPVAPNVTPTAVLLRALGFISAICGLIIVGSYEITLPAANANRRIALERAVLKVVPTAKSIVEYYALPAGGIEQAKSGEAAPPGVAKFYAGYDDNGKLTGIAAEGGAKGYAELVRIMFGYDPICQCVTGMSVVTMRETPGIGDKILIDKDFLANFKALDVKLKDDLSSLANEVKAVKHGTKTNPWQIDAIAGATVTSRAVGKGINDAAEFLLPKLVPNIEKLKVKS